MRIALIVQRYGLDIVGGAERLCRGVSEGLVGRGHDVEVFTTCARSYRTWANAMPEGLQTVNSVPVRRFRVERERDMGGFNAASERLFGRPHDADDETAWVEAQGPYAPRLVDHLHGVADDFERLVFFTYLYYPTVHGIHVAPRRSIMAPTAHDEAPLYLPIYEAVFALPAGLVFNSEAEAELVTRRFPRAAGKRLVAGVGIDDIDALAAPTAGDAVDISAPPDAIGADGRREEATGAAAPTLLYAGRIEAGKGVADMIDYVGRFRTDSGAPVRLELMGEVAMQIPDEPWIEELGFVDDAEKIRRLRAADVLIAPSPLESFGIVVLEAMAAGTPALVNGTADAVVEHCRKANAGLYYRDYGEFRAALGLLLDDERLRATMARRGASYVRENYSWPEVVSCYERFMKEI